MVKKALARPVVAYNVPGTVLIWSTKDTTTRTAAEISVTTCLSSRWSTVILQGCLTSAPARLVSYRDVIGFIPSASFKSSMVALLFWSSPRIFYFSLSWLGGKNSRSIHLAYHNGPILMIQGTNLINGVKLIFQLLSTFTQMIHSETGEITSKWMNILTNWFMWIRLQIRPNHLITISHYLGNLKWFFNPKELMPFRVSI